MISVGDILDKANIEDLMKLEFDFVEDMLDEYEDLKEDARKNLN